MILPSRFLGGLAVLEQKKSCLAIDVGRRSLRMLLLRRRQGRLFIDGCKKIDITKGGNLSAKLGEVIDKMAPTVRRQEGAVACSISSKDFKQCRLELPIEMDKRDVEAHLRLSASQHFSDEEAKWICDFQLQACSKESKMQGINLYALTDKIINYYLDLMSPLPWRFSILEPDFSSLWRGFMQLVTAKQRVALLLQQEDRVCFLSGKEGELDVAYIKAENYPKFKSAK